MPNGAANARAEQLATLSAIIHQMMVAPTYGQLLDTLNGESTNGGLEDWQKAAVRESLRDYGKATKLPEEHVREFAKAQSLAHHSWKHARAESNFSLFADSLKHLVDLKRKEAEYHGYAENPYDALIDEYEPGMTAAQLRPVFDRLGAGTRALLSDIGTSGAQVDDSVLYRDFDTDRQLQYSRELVSKLGFSYDTGRVDLSAHPFCTSFSQSDVRLTTRIFKNDLRSCLFGLIHEAGHGMYEQGFDSRFARTVLANGTSMGIHESQSLFWENMIARSEQFWNWAFPSLQAAFPDQLNDTSALDFYKAINVVKPSLIRIEADEMTYNMHIVLRFGIEDDLINGRLQVEDIPATWNARMEELLGITPPSDALGCLQDIHWSFGGFGYFPSYTLGKLYAAMLFEKMSEDIPDLPSHIERGEFNPILSWLREKVHRWGKTKTASELVMEICGLPLSEEAFLRHMKRKVERVYGQ